ncbi:MAG TPA: GGDEF domain-containing protein [Kineosporiaceae bacterium]
MIEYRMVTGDGRTVWVEGVLRPEKLTDGAVVMSTRLIDERMHREEHLRRQATTDPLTGLANRAPDDALARPDAHQPDLHPGTKPHGGVTSIGRPRPR